MNSKINVHKITAMGLMTALVFVSNYIQFGIETPIGPTRLHIANGICLLATLLFGSLEGGLAAGLGSFLYDLTNPAYAATSWVTFILKFLLAFIGGLVVYAGRKEKNTPAPLWRRIVGSIAGSLSYVVLYCFKQYIEKCLILGLEKGAVILDIFSSKLPVSLINAAIAVPVAVLLYGAISPALKKAGLSERMQIR